MSGEHETNEASAAPASAPPEPLCWICKISKADSGEHKTKRSDLLAVLGKPSQKQPFFYSDIKRRNQVVGSLDAKILKSPVRICAYCNNTRTQPHDRAWERMSDRLRSRPLAIGRWVRCERIFRHFTKREMIAVHLYFLKLFGCMIAEAKANGHDVPIDLDAFSSAIMLGRPHLEVHLQFGRNDGELGRSDLHLLQDGPGRCSAWGMAISTGHDCGERLVRTGPPVRGAGGHLASALAHQRKAIIGRQFHVQEARRAAGRRGR